MTSWCSGRARSCLGLARARPAHDCLGPLHRLARIGARRASAVGGLAGDALFGAVSTFSALKPLLLYRDHFDRQAGLLKLGGFGLKGTYPLDKVLAVQLVPGGLIAKAPGPSGTAGSASLSAEPGDSRR